jgi:DNA replication protein DnaC
MQGAMPLPYRTVSHRIASLRIITICTFIAILLKGNIQVTSNNSENCKICGSPAGGYVHPFTRAWVAFTLCRDCERKRHEEQVRENQIIAKREFLNNIKSHLIRRDAPARHLEAVLSETMPENMRRLANDDRLPCFSGPTGTGKTYKAVQVMLCRAQIDPFAVLDEFHFSVGDDQLPLFLSAPDLALKCRSSFGRRDGLSEQAILDRYSNVRVLVLDDLGTESTSDYSLATIYTLINSRYDSNNQTCITTNMTIQQLAKRIGDRCVSRISEMCRVVPVRGVDRRLQEIPLGKYEVV